ncbi:hypothetical protein [Hellea balneolensis]|uniref:hypothetical protein n=1 Tax=Hellea balneolensis TaxID=287478 RepID=UPI0004130B9B|nr:hypothetical protein [Hellea balneolensis]
MIKFFLSSALITPCLIMPLMGFTSGVDHTLKAHSTSFEAAYIEPQLKELDNCMAAELDVYFHENYITLHSAEYIAEGVELAKDCNNPTYTITPIIPTTSHIDEDTITNTRLSELTLMLKAHGVSSRIGDTVVQETYDSLSDNGRTAKIKIAFDQSDNA